MGTLVLNGATSGSTTLQPTDATTQTITLPANSGTVITTQSSGKVIPTAALPAGTVLQVVNATTATPASTTSTSPSSSSNTGLLATITPTSATSKILVIAQMGSIQNNNNGNGMNLWLYRNNAILYGFGVIHGYWTVSSGAIVALVQAGGGATYIDSPATTSPTTYSVAFASNTSGQTVTTQANGGASSITLMEIAA